METNILNKLLLSELRVVAINTDKDHVINDNDTIKAMTVNEELLALGYIIDPRDIVALAKSTTLYNFYEEFISLLGDVKADPMYPDFPNQVMSMDEAQFRFDQLVHYFSTYGIMELTGEEVDKGWLPEVDKTIKTEIPAALLDAKVIKLVDINYVPEYVLTTLLTKRERLTDPEKLLVSDVLYQFNITSAELLKDINIAFKENLYDIFELLFKDYNAAMMHDICQHTGDVWKCISYLLSDSGLHGFKTSQKRMLVNLLESYPAADFEANLILSNKKAEEIKNLLNYLSYNRFSKSPAHKNAVAMLRDNKLSSWEGKAKALIATKDNEALSFIAKRPGMMLRMLTLLLRNGFNKEDIIKSLSPVADQLSTQTLITLARHFGEENPVNFNGELHDKSEVLMIYEIATKLIQGNLASKKIDFADKKVYLDMHNYSLNNSYIETNDKSKDGGYIRSGLAYKIPDDVNRIRFFVYWNDKRTMDVDLHSCIKSNNSNILDIGWDANFKEDYVAFSGDITHSDAAEYIDIDLKAGKDIIKDASLNIDLYSASDYFCPVKSFSDLDECFAGIMAVNDINENVKLYDVKNCFFAHDLTTSSSATLNYGYIDVENRCLVFNGKDGNGYYDSSKNAPSKFTLAEYLSKLLVAQNCTLVNDISEADTVLIMEKPTQDNQVSLIDNNFFMD